MLNWLLEKCKKEDLKSSAASEGYGVTAAVGAAYQTMISAGTYVGAKSLEAVQAVPWSSIYSGVANGSVYAGQKSVEVVTAIPWVATFDALKSGSVYLGSSTYNWVLSPAWYGVKTGASYAASYSSEAFDVIKAADWWKGDVQINDQGIKVGMRGLPEYLKNTSVLAAWTIPWGVSLSLLKAGSVYLGSSTYDWLLYPAWYGVKTGASYAALYSAKTFAAIKTVGLWKTSLLMGYDQSIKTGAAVAAGIDMSTAFMFTGACIATALASKWVYDVYSREEEVQVQAEVEVDEYSNWGRK